jgi:hypothetical protein
VKEAHSDRISKAYDNQRIPVHHASDAATGAFGLYELKSERALRDMQRIGQLRCNRRNIAKVFLGKYPYFFILYPEVPSTSAGARMRPS